MFGLAKQKFFMLILIATVLFGASLSVEAGQVVVRKSSEPFDAFAVRDQVLRDHEWQELLRMQRQLNILQSLPIGCVPLVRPYPYYSCGRNFYRPYRYHNQELYIQIDPIDTDVVPLDR
ncbi:hypothetical protein [Shewanella atlantica]|uniref:hypothetical protein n=1 Tax=Shewanella atlantica TaxID=271099 RepID=UPI003735DFDB